MLSESARNYIVQVAADKVVEGIDPPMEDFESKEEILILS